MEGSGRSGASKTGQARRSRSKSVGKTPAESLLTTPTKSEPADMPPLSPVLRKIPRPPNAFILYRSAKMREIGKKNTQSQSGTGLGKLDYQRQLSKHIGQLWRDETAEVKAAFYEKSQQAAREHAARYPEYRFKPSKKLAPSPEPASTPTRSGPSATMKTPDRSISSDFGPVDLSGPVSGSGSGSGRKRASLESARSKASPYSESRHRRASSSGSPSSSRHHPSDLNKQGHKQKQNPNRRSHPVLLYTEAPTFVSPSRSSELEGAVSNQAFMARDFNATDQKGTPPSPYHRSSVGHSPTHPSSQTDFDTLLPQHLRERPHVFLAPVNAPQVPPVPIGQAITTTEAVAALDLNKETNHRNKPKVGLAEAVKRALPPERRALLHASLIKKGLLPETDTKSPNSRSQSDSAPSRAGDEATQSQFTSQESTPSLTQTDSWNSVASSSLEMGRAHTWHSQDSTQGTGLNHSHWYSGGADLSAKCLLPALDPALHDSVSMAAMQGPSINLSMQSADAAKFQELSVWNPPEQEWSDNSWIWASTSQESGAPASIHPMDASASQPTSSSQQETGGFAFSTIEVGRYDSGDVHLDPVRAITEANSAILSLSQSWESGGVQGHMYGLNGELIGQGTVNNFGREPGAGLSAEEASQQRAVELLLQQMLGATTNESDYTQSQHTAADASQTFADSQSQYAAYSQDAQEWSDWQQSALSAMTSESAQEASDHRLLDQQWSISGHDQADGSLPATGADASTASGYAAAHCQEVREAPGWEEAQNAYTHVAGGVWTEHQSVEQSQVEQENAAEASSSSVSRGLRSWKAAQLSSIKERFTRIRQRSMSTPPAATLALP